MNKMNITLAGIVYAVFMIASCNDEKKQTDNAQVDISNDSLVKKGAYLVTIMGCHDCHTPKIMTEQGPGLDMEHLLSGHPAKMPIMPFDSATTKDWVLFNMTGTAMVGPWGASFAANLTSDDTGIGTWTEEQFKKSMKEGKLKGLDGSRQLLPPMPWQNFAEMKDDEIKAIFAYLKSTKPVENIVPNPIAPPALAQYKR